MRTLAGVDQAGEQVVAAEALRPVDRLVLGWLVAAGLAPLVFRSVPEWPALALAHAAMIAAAVSLIAWNALWPSPLSRFLREAWPLLFLIPLYETVGRMIHLVNSSVYDAQIVALERAVLGAGFWAWMQGIERRWLTEILQLFYFCFYLIMALPAVWLYARGDLRGFRRLVSAVMAAFVPCYAIFVLVPVEGPRFYLADQLAPQRGLALTPYVQALVAHAGHRGAAMPSSHCAAAVAALGAGWSADRRLGRILLVLVVGLSLATVYGRYHYPTDVVVGILVGLLALRLRLRAPFLPTPRRPRTPRASRSALRA